MCRPMWMCMVTEAIRSRMVWVITGVLALLVLLALPAKAESADYETTLDRLGRLQALAEQNIEEKNSGDSRNTRLYNDVLRLQRQHSYIRY